MKTVSEHNEIVRIIATTDINVTYCVRNKDSRSRLLVSFFANVSMFKLLNGLSDFHVFNASVYTMYTSDADAITLQTCHERPFLCVGSHSVYWLESVSVFYLFSSMLSGSRYKNGYSAGHLLVLRLRYVQKQKQHTKNYLETGHKHCCFHISLWTV